MDPSTGTSRYGLVTDSGSAHWYGRDGSPQHHTNVKGAIRHGYYPSVTSYLKVWPKPALDRWKIEQAIMSAITLPRMPNEADDAFAKRVAEDMGEEAKSAAKVGSDLHELMNVRLVTGAWPTDKPQLSAWMEMYEPWISANIVETIMSERVLTNDEWGYAGTVDLIAKTTQWGTAVLDFKNQNVRATGPAFYDEWLMQLVAYGMAYDENLIDETKSGVDCLVSLVLDRNKPAAPYVHVWPYKDWSRAWDKFRSCMELWCLWKDYDPIAWEEPVTKVKAKKKAVQQQLL